MNVVSGLLNDSGEKGYPSYISRVLYIFVGFIKLEKLIYTFIYSVDYIIVM